MKYRLDKKDLLREMSAWNSFLKRKVNLIACGGTALTLLEVKESTKDVDFMVPVDREYTYLIRILKDLGYTSATGSGWSRGGNYIFDLYKGNKIHTTTLLDSPLLKGNNILLKEFSNIYLGILNFYDIIISKLFRGTSVDFEDCFRLIKVKKSSIDLNFLKERFIETASYDVAEDRVNRNFDSFLKRIEKEGRNG